MLLLIRANSVHSLSLLTSNSKSHKLSYQNGIGKVRFPIVLQVPFDQGLEMLRIFKAEAIKSAPQLVDLAQPESVTPASARAEETEEPEASRPVTPQNPPAEIKPPLEQPEPAAPAEPPSTAHELPRVADAPASHAAERGEERAAAIARKLREVGPRVKKAAPKESPTGGETTLAPVRIETREASQQIRTSSKKAEATKRKAGEAIENGNTGLYGLLEVESPAGETSEEEEKRPQPTEQQQSSVQAGSSERNGNTGAQAEWEELFLGDPETEDERKGDLTREQREERLKHREERLIEQATALVGRLPSKGIDAR